MSERAATGIRGWIGALLHSRLMPVWLVVVSFLENTVLPIAIEPLVIPVMAARRRQAFFFAFLLALGSLLGALAAYGAASALFEPLVKPALASGGMLAGFDAVRADVDERGFWALFAIGVTPVPFQLGTVAAGLLGMPLAEFVAAVVLARGLRYAGLAVLVFVIGARAGRLIARYETEMTVGFFMLFLALLLGGWAFAGSL